MTQDEIIALAREAGLATTDHGNPNGYAEFCTRLERFANLVAEAKKAEYEKMFDEVFGELIEKINGGMSAESAIRSMK